MDWAYGVAIDNSGNVLATGCFTGAVDFDPSDNTDLRYAEGGEYPSDPYLVGYTQDGNYLWAVTWNGPSNDSLQKVVCPVTGNVYVTGHFEESLDFDPGTGSDVHASLGDYDLLFEKLNY